MTPHDRACVLSRACLAGIALAGAALAAQAQTQVLPGLWEQTMTTKTDNAQMNAAMAQMQERLAAMPPEQRKAMEQMMASHGVGAASAPQAMRVCLTREQVEHELVPDGDNGRCTRKNVERSGNTTKFSFVCEGRAQVSGQGVYTVVGPKSFTVATDADMTVQGKPSHIHADLAGRFVSSDCGDVKPMQPPPATR